MERLFGSIALISLMGFRFSSEFYEIKEVGEFTNSIAEYMTPIFVGILFVYVIVRSIDDVFGG